MHAIVAAADIQDRDGGALVMTTLFGAFPFLVKLYADGGYQGAQFQGALKRIVARQPSRSSSDRIGASSFCPSAGSSNAPSPGSAAAAGSPRIGNVSTARRSPSCASPPSASCCENYATPHDVSGQTLRRTTASGSTYACSRSLLSRAFAPIHRPMLKGSKGSRLRKKSSKKCERSRRRKFFAIFLLLIDLRPRRRLCKNSAEFSHAAGLGLFSFFQARNFAFGRILLKKSDFRTDHNCRGR
jgi:hypothetical protein